MDPLLQRAARRVREFLDSVRAPDAKPWWRQLYEITCLRRGPNHLSAAQYFWMNLGNQRIYKNVDLESFGGTYQTVALHRRLNSPHWDAVVTDKLVMWSLFSRCQVPQPRMLAAACRFPRAMGGLPVFQCKPDLVRFLEQDIDFPFFCKPVKGGSAKGCRRVDSLNARGLLVLADGLEISAGDFVDALEDPEGWGYLFQEAMTAHPGTRDMCGNAPTGCRVVMLVSDDGPKIFRVIWKLPMKGNYVDNFVSGKTGNLLADVDPETGRVRRVVANTYTDLKVNPAFPGGVGQLVGEQLPDWDRLRTTMEAAAISFPGFRFQHWDVGLTSRGPVVYELNTAGDLYLPELSRGSGVFDAELQAFLHQYDNQATRRQFAGGSPVLDGPLRSPQVSRTTHTEPA